MVVISKVKVVIKEVTMLVEVVHNRLSKVLILMKKCIVMPFQKNMRIKYQIHLLQVPFIYDQMVLVLFDVGYIILYISNKLL